MTCAIGDFSSAHRLATSTKGKLPTFPAAGKGGLAWARGLCTSHTLLLHVHRHRPPALVAGCSCLLHLRVGVEPGAEVTWQGLQLLCLLLQAHGPDKLLLAGCALCGQDRCSGLTEACCSNDVRSEVPGSPQQPS